MTGEKLHAFDVQLCRHALDNIASHSGRAGFAAFVEEGLDPAVLAYLKALDGDAEPAPLLLSDAELEDLAGVFGGEEIEFDPDWIPYEALYRRSIDCVGEVRDALAKPYADEWASLAAQFAEQLGSPHVWLHDGIEVVREWVGEVRRLLRAMGATELLPPPQGTFPTPTCPEPPALPSKGVAAVSNGPRNDDALAAALTEIRDLLLSQRAVRDWYSTEEVAQLLGKAEFTVREWCRNGRIHAEKKGSGRGKYQSWVVAHAELLRFQREGLLPVER